MAESPDVARDSAPRLHRFDRWLYRGGRPNRLARLMNRASATLFSVGLLPNRAAALRVPGRRTRRVIEFPVVIADHGGERYLVAMLGQNTNWIRNVRAAGGRAELRHGRRETVRLDEVDPEHRAPILRRYLAVAPGARSHIPVDQRHRWRSSNRSRRGSRCSGSSRCRTGDGRGGSSFCGCRPLRDARYRHVLGERPQHPPTFPRDR